MNPRPSGPQPDALPLSYGHHVCMGQPPGVSIHPPGDFPYIYRLFACDHTVIHYSIIKVQQHEAKEPGNLSVCLAPSFFVLLLGARPHWTAIIGLGCRHNNSALPDRFNCRGVELRFMLASGFHGSFGCGPMKPHTVGILNVGCGFVNTKSQRIRELFYLEIC